jgi:carbonic anhydrase/acetyltransferase-like protein (isoleucine patch superfamily)
MFNKYTEYTVRNSGARVHAGAHITDSATLCTGVVIHSDANVMHFAHLSAGCRVGQRSRIGMYAFVGENAVITQDVKVGNRVKIGSGAFLGLGCSVAAGVDISENSEIEADHHITQDTIAITGLSYNCTLTEFGIKLGCNPPRFPAEFRAIKDLASLGVHGDNKYRENLNAVLVLWESYFTFN